MMWLRVLDVSVVFIVGREKVEMSSLCCVHSLLWHFTFGSKYVLQKAWLKHFLQYKQQLFSFFNRTFLSAECSFLFFMLSRQSVTRVYCYRSVLSEPKLKYPDNKLSRLDKAPTVFPGFPWHAISKVLYHTNLLHLQEPCWYFLGTGHLYFWTILMVNWRVVNKLMSQEYVIPPGKKTEIT